MRDEIICGIYKITSPTNSIYIGQSCDILNTWSSRYKKKTLFCQNQPKLYNSLIKYGWQAHKFEIVETCDVDFLNERERYYVNFYDTYKSIKGLNCTIGGDGARGLKWSEESKLKAKVSKRKLYDSGYKNPLKGIKLSEERRIRIKETSKGRNAGKSNSFYGKKHTEEMKKIIGQKSIGRKFSEEVKRNASIRMSGEKNHMFGIKLNGDKNGMFGKKHKKSSFINQCKKILNTETNITYYGFEDAAKSIGIKRTALQQRFRRGTQKPFIICQV